MHDPEQRYQMRSYHYTVVAARKGMDAKLGRNLKTLQERIETNEPTMNRVMEVIEEHLHNEGWVPYSKMVVSVIQ